VKQRLFQSMRVDFSEKLAAEEKEMIEAAGRIGWRS
jgi:hypothetical protein